MHEVRHRAAAIDAAVAIEHGQIDVGVDPAEPLA